MKRKKTEKKPYFLKAAVAIAVALAFVMPGTAAFANLSDTTNNIKLDNTRTMGPLGTTIYVDDDNTAGPWNGTLAYPYQYIQDGLDAASDGDTVYVFNGTYYEDLTVNNPLDLIGESRDNVIVDGGGSGYVVYGKADNMNIENLTVRNGSRGFYFSGKTGNSIVNCVSHSNSNYGIYLYNSPSNYITDCEFYDNDVYGVYFRSAEYNNMTGTSITNDKFYIRADGLIDYYHDIDTSNTINGKPIYYLVGQSDITLDETDNLGYLGLISCTNITAENADANGVVIVDTSDSAITNISSHNSVYGIYLWQSSNIDMIDCAAYDNDQYGILLSESLNCNLEGNAVYDNLFDFRVAGSDISHFYHTMDTYNTVNGKPIYYLVEEEDLEFDGTGMGYLGLVSCNEITAKNLDLNGILLVNTSDSTISNIYTHNTYRGLDLFLSSNNAFTNCHFYSNYIGCHLWMSSNNEFEDCESYSNDQYVYYFLEDGDNNSFINCDSYGNSGYTRIKYSDNNNFINCDFYGDSRGPYLDHALGTSFTNCNFHDMGYLVYATSSSHYTNLTNCNIYDGSGRGISLSGCNGNTIVNCNIYNIAGEGGYLYMEDSTVSDCAFYNNTKNGMYLFVAENNRIENCITYDNDDKGIYLYLAENNEIVNCSSFNNNYGIYTFIASDNIIHHNSFFDNAVQNASDSGTNQWDDNVSEGNYWGDYTGIDADGDGIGDTPYNIPDGSNQDRYPLMEPLIAIPELLAPADNSSTPDQTPTFDWTDTVSTHYTLQVATDPGFIALVIDQTSILTSEYTPTTNLPYDIYYWRVRAVCGINGDWSEIWELNIIPNEAPNTPSRPSGPNEGNTEIEYTFSTTTIDPDENQVYYKWDWGDGTESVWLGPYDSGETAEANHTWTEEGYYAVKVKAKDIYDAESGWSGSLIVHIIAPLVPDLDCVGSLSWTNVAAGGTVTGEFTVENIGDPSSLLDWEIDDYPDWGIWIFTPSSGYDLKPEDGQITVDVTVIAPDVQNTEFTGNVTIVNKEDSSDFCTISVSLATPTSVPVCQPSSSLQVLQFLQQRFTSTAISNV